MLARDKRSSLLQKIVTYGRKMFYNIGTRCQDIKLFTAVSYDF